MTKPSRQHLRDVASKATRGPWAAITNMELISWDDNKRTHREPKPDVVFSEETRSTIVEQPTMLRERNGKDMQYIEAFDPPTALALLDQLDEMEAEVERLRNSLRAVKSDLEDEGYHAGNSTIEQIEWALQPQEEE